MRFAKFRRIGLTSLALYSSLLTIGISPAVAGPLATTDFALFDGFGPDAGRWRGSVAIAGAAFGDTIVAEVDWAAFARPLDGSTGKFQQFLNSEGIAQADPSAPGEVIYVYQIISVTTASPGIDTLTVGIDPADGRVAGSTTFIPAGGATEKSPAFSGDNTTSMVWFFNGNELQVGDTSSFLVFRSPFAPEFDFLQVNSGLAGPPVSPLVASPSDRLFQFEIPEPAGLILILLGAAALPARRRR